MSIMLSHKERDFIEYWLSGKNGTEAAMLAYGIHNRNSAAVIASNNLRKPKIINVIEIHQLNYQTLRQSLVVIGESLTATIGVSNLPDHKTRLRAATKLLKILESFGLLSYLKP
jgi:hypothetical protein